jgi:voltage-gated potassium channel
MTSAARPGHSFGHHHEGRFVALFVLALVFHVALPSLRDFDGLTVIIGLSLVAVLGYAGWITIEHRRARLGYSSLMVISLASTSALLVDGSGAWRTAWLGFHALLVGLSATLVVRWTVSRSRATLDTIFAALSGYYLVGFTWALVYALIDIGITGAFSVPLADGNRIHRAFYFSFVTLTTLGFGDITPTHPLTQSLVIIEALMGQIYLVVLVARLVAMRNEVEQTRLLR